MNQYQSTYLSRNQKTNYLSRISYENNSEFNRMYSESMNLSLQGPFLGDYSKDIMESSSASYMKRLPPLTNMDKKYRFFLN